MAEYRREPNILPVDHGYASDNVDKTIEARDVVPVIPMRKTQQAAYHCRSKPLPAAQPRRARLHLVEERPSHRHPLRQTAEAVWKRGSDEGVVGDRSTSGDHVREKVEGSRLRLLVVPDAYSSIWWVF